jgi:hypothetical protein
VGKGDAVNLTTVMGPNVTVAQRNHQEKLRQCLGEWLVLLLKIFDLEPQTFPLQKRSDWRTAHFSLQILRV